MLYMSFRKLWSGVLLFIALAGVGSTTSAEVGAAEATRTGTIEKLNFADGTMILDGNRYYATPELHVEIGGSYGAFTMLVVGMKVQIIYRVVSTTQRDMIEIIQIPDNFAVGEV